jgi:c-di-GMP phosphodiesterase Gmr
MANTEQIDFAFIEALPECEPQPLAPSAAETSDLQHLLEQTRQREQDARRALNLLVTIVDELPVGLTVQSDDGKTLFTNGTAGEFFGTATSSEPSPEVSESEAAKSDATMLEDCVSGPDGERTILRSCRPAKILDRDLVLSASIDFTKRKQIETELSKRAYFDDLTGLPNRTLIQDHVEQLLAKAKAAPRFALAFIDIDNFKHINDYYTHAIGDTLLVKVAQRIAAHIRPSDVVGRISGDEFLLVLEPVENDDDLASIVDRILLEMKEPFLIEGYEILTSASIGVSVYPDHGLNYEMLRRAADTAMYRIKGAAKGGAALFDSDMGRDMTVRMAQEQRLRLAVRDGRKSTCARRKWPASKPSFACATRTA